MGDTNFSAVEATNFKRGTVTFDVVRGTNTASSSKAIAHGLTTLATAFITPTASTGTQANNVDHYTYRASGGTVTIYGWKHTSAGTTTLKAATTAGTFSYLFLGTA